MADSYEEALEIEEARERAEEADQKWRKNSKEQFEDWTYECACLECNWRVEWVDAASWKRGAARVHADQYNHRVRTTSTKVITPKPTQEPKDEDRYVAWCRDCKKNLCVGAKGRFFAGVHSHERATGHAVDVTKNPKYVPRKKVW